MEAADDDADRAQPDRAHDGQPAEDRAEVPAEAPVQALPRTWSLALKDWVLSSPEGRSLPLTTHEFLFVQHLVQA